MSRDKGKRGEREVVALLISHGFEARRGQQFRGGSDSPDIIHNIPNLHIEVKYREVASLRSALEQASEDLVSNDFYPATNVPVVFHRQRRKPWIVVMDAHDFLQIMEALRSFGQARGRAA